MQWVHKCFNLTVNSLKMSMMAWTSLMVQWLRLHTSAAGGTGLIPGRGNKVLHAAWCAQKRKKLKEMSMAFFYLFIFPTETVFLSDTCFNCLTTCILLPTT